MPFSPCRCLLSRRELRAWRTLRAAPWAKCEKRDDCKIRRLLWLLWWSWGGDCYQHWWFSRRFIFAKLYTRHAMHLPTCFLGLTIVEDTKIEDIKGNKTSTIFYTSLSWDTIVLRAAPKWIEDMEAEKGPKQYPHMYISGSSGTLLRIGFSIFYLVGPWKGLNFYSLSSLLMFFLIVPVWTNSTKMLYTRTVFRRS